ncbi:hypothetical protein HA466_0101150 [Hirschfeldia incana]|nr:hypothetical protein HA466_0101150 [Hirschfeldia incana]
MARPNNKNTPLNYNHILQKDPSSSPASYSSVARSNGRMLVLTKPSPKPLKSYASSSTTTTATAPPPAPRTPDQANSDPDPNQISLRPLGHTGGPASSLSFPSRTQESDKDVSSPALTSVSPKPDRFVPPHLRPGFVRKDEKLVLAPSSSSSILGLPHQEQQRHQGYSGYGHTGRPKSGGYERIRSDPEYLGRPRSSGNRPGTSG